MCSHGLIPAANVVKDLELIGELDLDRVDEGIGCVRGVMHDMRRKTGFAAGQRPDVQVMHAHNAGCACDQLTNRRNVDAVRHAFEQDVQALFEQLPGAG